MRLTSTAIVTARNDVGQFIKQHITPNLVERMHEVGKRGVELAQSYVAVDTGELKASIGYRVDVAGARVVTTFYANAAHAAFNEFGTGRRGSSSPDAGPYSYGNTAGMAPHPFMRPMADVMRGEVRGILTSQPLLTV